MRGADGGYWIIVKHRGRERLTNLVPPRRDYFPTGIANALMPMW